MDRKKIIREVLEFLNDEEVRCTYSAVADLLGIDPKSVGDYLGERRQEASWVVGKQTFKPTGYLPEQIHPNLYATPKVICDAQELWEKLLEFQSGTHD